MHIQIETTTWGENSQLTLKRAPVSVGAGIDLRIGSFLQALSVAEAPTKEAPDSDFEDLGDANFLQIDQVAVDAMPVFRAPVLSGTREVQENSEHTGNDVEQVAVGLSDYTDLSFELTFSASADETRFSADDCHSSHLKFSVSELEQATPSRPESIQSEVRELSVIRHAPLVQRSNELADHGNVAAHNMFDLKSELGPQPDVKSNMPQPDENLTANPEPSTEASVKAVEDFSNAAGSVGPLSYLREPVQKMDAKGDFPVVLLAPDKEGLVNRVERFTRPPSAEGGGLGRNFKSIMPSAPAAASDVQRSEDLPEQSKMATSGQIPPSNESAPSPELVHQPKNLAPTLSAPPNPTVMVEKESVNAGSESKKWMVDRAGEIQFVSEDSEIRSNETYVVISKESRSEAEKRTSPLTATAGTSERSYVPSEYAAQFVTDSELDSAGSSKSDQGLAEVRDTFVVSKNLGFSDQMRHSLETQMSQRVSAQIVEASKQLSDRPVEISLSPEELGKVKMTLQISDTGSMTVVVAVERPETLELMRRNVDGLIQEFRDLGYEGSRFEFRQQGENASRQQSHQGDGARGMETQRQPAQDTLEQATDVSVHPLRLHLRYGAGVDMRL